MNPLQKPHLTGLLLAAGRGRRMGGAKQFHPWSTSSGTKPLVLAAFDAIASVCDSMIVVLGHRADEVAKLLAERKFETVLSDPDQPMFHSIRAGLVYARENSPGANVLLHPADHPEVASSTLKEIINAAQQNPQHSIMSEHAGQGGHPVLIPQRVIKQILASDCPQGLRQFWIDHPETCKRIKVDDPTTIHDIDQI